MKPTTLARGALLGAFAFAAACGSEQATALSLDDEARLLDAFDLVCDERASDAPLAASPIEGPRPHENALRVTILPDRVSVDGERRGYEGVGSDPGLHARLTTDILLRLEEGEVTPGDDGVPVIALYVDPAAPAWWVAEWIAWLDVSAPAKLQIVLGVPSSARVELPDPAYAATLKQRLDAAGSERSTVLARELIPMVDQCPAVREVFVELAEATASDRCRVLVRGLRRSIPSCSAAAFEKEKFLSAISLSVAPSDRSIPVAFDVDVAWLEPPEIRVPRSQTWADWAPGVVKSLEHPGGLTFERDTPQLDEHLVAMCDRGGRGRLSRGAKEACLRRCVDGTAATCDVLEWIHPGEMAADTRAKYLDDACSAGDVLSCAWRALDQGEGEFVGWLADGAPRLVEACEGGRIRACSLLAESVYGARAPRRLANAKQAARFASMVCQAERGSACKDPN
jgi:hypothetical protein